MSRNILRDEKVLPELAGVANFAGWLELVTDGLCEAWPEGRRQRVRPAIRLVVDFNSWELLVKREGLEREAAVNLAGRLLRCLGDE
jgi:hypothetical protein